MKKYILTAVIFSFVTISHAQIEKNVGDFTSLKTTNRIKIELIPSDENKIVVKESQEDAVSITNKNGRLVLKNTLKELVTEGEYSVTLEVYFKDLKEIDAQGGSYIYTEKPIVQESLKLSANVGSTIEGSLKVDNLNASANTGAKLILKGSVSKSVKLSGSAGAQITANELTSPRTKIVVNSGSNASVTATEFVDAQVIAGGKIKIYGNPKDVKEKVSVGGTIERVK